MENGKWKMKNDFNGQCKMENVIVDKSYQFALRIVKVYKYLSAKKDFVLSKQLLKSGTSIGANVVEAQEAISKKEFKNKMSIALKEAVEGRYWLGLSDETFSNPFNHNPLDDFDTDAEAWGIYVKPMYPITDAFDIYALLGYGSATVNNVQIAGTNRDFDIDGFSWGLGASYAFTDNFSIFVDYVDFSDDSFNITDGSANFSSDHEFDSWNFGVTYQF